ncbi:MAG: hypothetical protein OCC49_12575 [Fibrobacterales bacterium]
MKKMSLGIAALLIIGLVLTGCGSTKPSNGSEGPKEIEGDVTEMSERALRLEKENHELKKEIFNLKRELGMPIED